MKVALFDVDGTLTKSRVWKGLMDYFSTRGMRRLTNVLFWAYHIPLFFLHKFGIISQTRFRKPWARHLPWYFRGYTIEAAKEVWEWVIGEYLTPYWRMDTREILAKHLSEGFLIVLVSAGPKPLTEKVAKVVGAAHVIGTTPEVIDGVYTGKITGEVCIAENKGILTKKLFDQLGEEIDYDESYAYADSVGDIALFELVGNPVATHPDKELRKLARSKGWTIFPRAHCLLSVYIFSFAYE